MGRFGTLLTLALTVFSLGGASHALRTHNHAAFRDAQTYEDLYYLPPTDWLRVFSFGWDEAAADLIWMRALVYFGDEFLHVDRRPVW